MAQLTADQQRFIVLRLACFMKPKKIAEELEKHPDDNMRVKITNLSQISYYDPTNLTSSHDLDPEWVNLFRDTRRRFNESEADIAIASRTYRLRLLDDLLEHPFVQMGPALQMEVLAQAAKERGGMFEARVSPVEAENYVREMAEELKAAIDQTVTNPQERDRAKSKVKEFLEAKGDSRGG